MKRIGRLLPSFCSLALLGAAGCALESETASTRGESVGTTTQALAGWSPWHGGTNENYESGPSGNYIGMNLQAGGIIDAAYFRIYGQHTDPQPWPVTHVGDFWSPRYGGPGGGVQPNMFCPANLPYVVGIKGASGNNIGSLGIICGSTTDPAMTALPVAGRNDWGNTTPFEEICDMPLIVTGVNAYYGAYLNAIQIRCGYPVY